MEKGMSERFTDIPFQRIVSNGFYLHRLIYWIYLCPFMSVSGPLHSGNISRPLPVQIS